MPLTSGSKLGPYEIVSLLGAGGMGEVYRARDPKLARDVAVKVLPEDFLEGEDRKERFEREARLLAALNHPGIAAIYSFEEISSSSSSSSSVPVLVMELLEGETLRERLRRGRIGPREALDTAAHVARGLAAAHAKGIVHRDVKPENVFITKDGLVKILDFGLGKLRAAVDAEAPTEAAITKSGEFLGTVSYMSPEQLRNPADVDARSDVFSLGVLLFELLAGRRPFDGASAAETASKILTSEPPGLSLDAGLVPAETDLIVRRALAKVPEGRYPDAAPFAAALEAARDEIDFRARLARGGAPRVPRAAWRVLSAVLAAAALAGAWFWARRSRLEGARQAVPRAAALARDGRWAEAFDLVQRARRELPADAALLSMLPDVADVLSVASEPPGARVLLRRYDPAAGPDGGPSRDLGPTPLKDVAIARGDYVLRLEKDGYEPFERTVSSALERTDPRLPSVAIAVAWRMRKAGTVPPASVFVPAGTYKLVGYGQPTASSVPLREYFIDRYEVSNREFAEFVSAGGYRNRALWTEPFAGEGGSRVGWEDGMRRLVDRTGLPGPRGWSGGTFPDGKSDHPVSGVSWYEASAYARFRGKTLPTIFQWEKAARDGIFTVTGEIVMPWGLQRGADARANFDGKGTVPVRQGAFGMGPFGCYHMAGNVSEWTRNAAPGGFVTAGGAYTDPPYLFGDYGIYPGLGTSERIGFRCALAAPGTGEEGDAPISRAEQAPTYPRATPAQFETWLAHYRYDRAPPDGRVEERAETPEWTRERVSFAAGGGTRIKAWLYLPKSARPPFQVVQFVPASNAYSGQPITQIAESDRFSPLVKAGRAFFVVDLPGYPGRERPPGYRKPDGPTVAFRQRAVAEATDIRRGLDYLETRKDVDMSRLAFMNASISWQGIIFSAVEPRYRSVIFVAAGLYPEQAGWVAEANPVNFAPHIRPPKLMVNGRWDEDFAFKTEAEPLFKLLSEPKSLEQYDGGHIPPATVLVRPVNAWLDRTLGPVAR